MARLGASVGGLAKALSVNERSGSSGVIGMASRKGVVSGLGLGLLAVTAPPGFKVVVLATPGASAALARPAALADPAANPTFRAVRRLGLGNGSTTGRSLAFNLSSRSGN